MNETVQTALKLCIFGTAAAFILALANFFTAPRIQAFREAAVQTTLQSIVPEGRVGKQENNPADNVSSRWPIDPDKGWVLNITAFGYGGPMSLMAAYSTEGSVLGARLLANNETVGFGKRAEEKAYMDIFLGTGFPDPVPVSKTALASKADVVSGATITFVGVAKGIAYGSALVKEWKK